MSANDHHAARQRNQERRELDQRIARASKHLRDVGDRRDWDGANKAEEELEALVEMRRRLGNFEAVVPPGMDATLVEQVITGLAVEARMAGATSTGSAGQELPAWLYDHLGDVLAQHVGPRLRPAAEAVAVQEEAQKLRDAAELLEAYVNEHIPSQETIGAHHLVDAVKRAAGTVKPDAVREVLAELVGRYCREVNNTVYVLNPPSNHGLLELWVRALAALAAAHVAQVVQQIAAAAPPVDEQASAEADSMIERLREGRERRPIGDS